MHSSLRALAQSSHADKEPMQSAQRDGDAFPMYFPTDAEMEEQYAAHLADLHRTAHPEIGEDE